MASPLTPSQSLPRSYTNAAYLHSQEARALILLQLQVCHYSLSLPQGDDLSKQSYIFC